MNNIKKKRRKKNHIDAQSNYHLSFIELYRRSIYYFSRRENLQVFYRDKKNKRKMIGGKPFDVESLLRDCVVKKKRPIHDAVQIYDQQQQQATDLSIGKDKLQSGIFKIY